MSNRFRTLPNGTIWTDPHCYGELKYKLMHAPGTITREDQLVLASICGEHQHLIGMGRKDREQICRLLRKMQNDIVEILEHECSQCGQVYEVLTTCKACGAKDICYECVKGCAQEKPVLAPPLVSELAGERS